MSLTLRTAGRPALAAAAAAFAALPLPALADFDGPGSYGPGMMWGYGPGGGGLLGPVMMVLIVAILVAVVVLVVRHFTGHHHHHQHGSRSLEILKERFARGEIDAEDFKVRRQLLND